MFKPLLGYSGRSQEGLQAFPEVGEVSIRELCAWQHAGHFSHTLSQFIVPTSKMRKLKVRKVNSFSLKSCHYELVKLGPKL